MPDIVYSTSDLIVSDQEGGVRLLAKNEAFSADHPIVVARPELFADFPEIRDVAGNVIEQTTANPGERRTVRRG